MRMHAALSRPRPEAYDSASPGPGGEGGNVRPRLAMILGVNGLLAMALLLSAVLVGLATAVLN